MRTHRFGRKLRLPSTVAIKHQLLMVMLEDEIRAASGSFKDSESPALAMLRRLRGAPTARVSLDQRRVMQPRDNRLQSETRKSLAFPPRQSVACKETPRIA